MPNFSRRHASLALLALLAACGKSAPSTTPARGAIPQFKRYSGPPVTQVVVNKAERRMFLLNGQTVLRSYNFGLGNQPLGPKQFEGDGKTPEGLYYIDRFNPRSRYHLSVGISYPNEQDKLMQLNSVEVRAAISCSMAAAPKAMSSHRRIGTGLQAVWH